MMRLLSVLWLLTVVAVSTAAAAPAGSFGSPDAVAALDAPVPQPPLPRAALTTRQLLAGND